MRSWYFWGGRGVNCAFHLRRVSSLRNVRWRVNTPLPWWIACCVDPALSGRIPGCVNTPLSGSIPGCVDSALTWCIQASLKLSRSVDCTIEWVRRVNAPLPWRVNASLPRRVYGRVVRRWRRDYVAAAVYPWNVNSSVLLCRQGLKITLCKYADMQTYISPFELEFRLILQLMLLIIRQRREYWCHGNVDYFSMADTIYSFINY